MRKPTVIWNSLKELAKVYALPSKQSREDAVKSILTQNRVTLAAAYLQPLVEAIKNIDNRSYENCSKEKASKKNRKGKTRRQRHR